MTQTTVTQAWASWAASYLAAPVAPMTFEESTLFASCKLNADTAGFPGEQVTNSFAYRLLTKRASLLGIELDPAVTAFMTVTCDSPGKLVMLISAIKYALRLRTPGEVGDDKLDMTILTDIFPQGFVRPDQLEALWDAQKCYKLDIPGDNLLDQISREVAVAPKGEVEPEPVEEAAKPAPKQSGKVNLHRATKPDAGPTEDDTQSDTGSANDAPVQGE